MKAIVISAIAVGLFITGSTMAEVLNIEVPQAAKKNNCTACHVISGRLVGPGWLEISEKYKGATKFIFAGIEHPLLEGLMIKVSRGGAGSWGTMPMPAYDTAGVKQAEIRELVTFVIGLEKLAANKKAGTGTASDRKAEVNK